MVDPSSLRRVRLEAHISLRKMAAMIGLSAPYIGDVELGRRHCTDRILKAYESL